MDFPIYLDIKTARERLPVVESYLQRLLQLFEELEVLSGIEVENEEADTELEYAATQLSKTFHKKMYLFHKYWEEILKLGVVVKDLQEGIIDFYCKHEGRDIFLCWKLGESNLEHWHEVDADFKERQHIDSLSRKII